MLYWTLMGLLEKSPIIYSILPERLMSRRSVSSICYFSSTHPRWLKGLTVGALHFPAYSYTKGKAERSFTDEHRWKFFRNIKCIILQYDMNTLGMGALSDSSQQRWMISLTATRNGETLPTKAKAETSCTSSNPSSDEIPSTLPTTFFEILVQFKAHSISLRVCPFSELYLEVYLPGL